MRCPKCEYISFDSVGRCRNCGYDFSLAPEPPPVELQIQDGTEAFGPLADFVLNDPADRGASTQDIAPKQPSSAVASLDLPLFKGSTIADAPLIEAGVPPHAPLSVRRPAPATPRPRSRRESAAAEPRLALDTAEIPIAQRPAPSGPQETAGLPTAVEAAPVGSRVMAGLVDLAILSGIDAIVLYFTLRICGLTFAQTLTLPMAPLAGFLLLLNGGYFASFVAASGQTIGKMTAGIRVIPGDPAARHSERVSFRHAVVRAVAYLVSALPAGLGYLPALVDDDRRALHDRLADTRVVKA